MENLEELYKLINSVMDLECRIISLHREVIELVHIAEDLRYKINDLERELIKE
jgi:hypothetical protein